MKVKTAWRSGEALTIEVTLRNEGDKQRLLDVGFYVPLLEKDFRWWNGRNVEEPGEEQMSYMRMMLRLPLSVVNGNTRGVAVGLDPRHFVSLFATEARPVAGGVQAGVRVRMISWQ